MNSASLAAYAAAMQPADQKTTGSKSKLGSTATLTQFTYSKFLITLCDTLTKMKQSGLVKLKELESKIDEVNFHPIEHELKIFNGHVQMKLLEEVINIAGKISTNNTISRAEQFFLRAFCIFLEKKKDEFWLTQIPSLKAIADKVVINDNKIVTKVGSKDKKDMEQMKLREEREEGLELLGKWCLLYAKEEINYVFRETSYWNPKASLFEKLAEKIKFKGFNDLIRDYFILKLDGAIVINYLIKKEQRILKTVPSQVTEKTQPSSSVEEALGREMARPSEPETVTDRLLSVADRNHKEVEKPKPTVNRCILM